MDYQPRAEDARFILFDVLQASDQLKALDLAGASDPGLQFQILEEAGKFVAEVVARLNTAGDSQGCQFVGGSITTPPGFKDAYKAFWQAGWPALAVAPEDGGQGLPWVLEGILYEWLSAANHGWTMAPGLLHGAYECIKHHASQDLKSRYLEKVASGEWLATMCLTEPHAGSDLGLVRTRAEMQADGSYRISGSKIFISGGEHDLTENIVHLVLARLADAPPGPRGLSLFIAPKLLENGGRNGVHCDRIEEKMGLHGSPTCAMRFDNATAWMVGEPGRGLSAMFVMMNAARLHVALQGIGLLDAAWQKADAYARERKQMRVPGATSSGVRGDAHAIIGHPAMRRVLDTQRAWVDGGRAIAYQTGLELDIARHHPDGARREAAQRWCSLVTPVLKAAWTEQAFHGASDCLQVFGGHGYIREWGIEQIVRDSRVTMIYEGTNEIQAIDLLVRKVLPDQGAGLAALSRALGDDVQGDEGVIGLWRGRLAQLLDATRAVCSTAGRVPDAAYWIASDYLRAVALVLLGWAWTRVGQVPGAGAGRWRPAQDAYWCWVFPELEMRLTLIKDTLARLDMPENHTP